MHYPLSTSVGITADSVFPICGERVRRRFHNEHPARVPRALERQQRAEEAPHLAPPGGHDPHLRQSPHPAGLPSPLHGLRHLCGDYSPITGWKLQYARHVQFQLLGRREYNLLY